VNVLLVDDYADALEVWELFLNAAGFTVTTATDGTTGLDKARTLRPDVIVMDLQMPGLSGSEVAQALRADAATRHIPLIAATGHSRTVLSDARAAGFDSVVVKPCDPDDLVSDRERAIWEDRTAHPDPNWVETLFGRDTGGALAQVPTLVAMAESVRTRRAIPLSDVQGPV